MRHPHRSIDTKDSAWRSPLRPGLPADTSTPPTVPCWERGYLVVVPPTEVDLMTLPAFEEQLAEADGASDLVINLRDASFFSVQGVEALVTVRDRIGPAGGTVTLRDPSATILRVLTILGRLDGFVIRRTEPPGPPRLSGTDARTR